LRILASTLISWGPIGVFLLAVLDSAGIPLPTAADALVLTLAAVNPSGAYANAAIAVLGSCLGNMMLFYIARRGGDAYLSRYTETGRGAKMRLWFLRYGLITIFIPAILPIPLPLKVFVLSAGALGVHPLRFLAVVFAARVPRYFGLAYLGSQLGSGAGPYLKTHVKEFMLVAVALFLVLFLGIKLAERMRTRGPVPGI
jgi:membrane protein DedA with SNARE-associated domain